MDVPSDQHGRSNIRFYDETGSNASRQSVGNPHFYSYFRIIFVSVFENDRHQKTVAEVGHRRLVGRFVVRYFGARRVQSRGEWTEFTTKSKNVS